MSDNQTVLATPILPPERWYVVSLKSAVLWSKRILAIVSPLVAIWVLVGSWMYPYWWFELLWGGYFNSHFMGEGFSYFIQENFGLALACVVFVFCFSMLSLKYKTRFVSLMDRFGTPVILTSAFVLCATALVVYHTQLPTSEFYSSLRALAAERSANSARAINTPHIDGPVDFQFVDSDRVAALYSQLESDMTEEKREVSSTGNLHGKLGVAVGTVTAEAEHSKGATSTSSFARTDLSAHKKCLIVMNHIIDKKQLPGYSDRERWIKERTFQDTLAELNAPTTIEPKQIKPIFLLPTPEELEKLQKKIEGYDAELQGNLQSLRGYVLVDGEFERTVGGNSVTLTRRFSNRPQQVNFRASIPKNNTQGVPEMNRIQMTMFADVLHPLSKDGYVDLRPLAIF